MRYGCILRIQAIEPYLLFGTGEMLWDADMAGKVRILHQREVAA